MTVSISMMIWVFAKLVFFVFIGAFSAMFFLWPINDRNTSVTQFVLWTLFCVAVFSIIFFHSYIPIHFVP